MRLLEVDLGERSYPIYIGSGLLGDSQYYRPHIKGNQVLVVTNETVAPLYLLEVQQALVGFSVDVVVLPDGEAYKDLTVLSRIYDELLTQRHNRTTTLVALGGGVIGDMTGFAAASYQRGVNFIQVPTTLLSQVDSSVGGKTAVNHALGKNMIGAFHQPQAVIADTKALATLPGRELSAGMAEVIKYGLICDSDLYYWLQTNISELMQGNEALLTEAIYRSCTDKANVVAQDETEQGIRAILNLGHTFGHAIEAHQGYGNWLHGEAVGAGMMMAAHLSHKLGAISAEDLSSLNQLLQVANLPTNGPSDMTVEDYLSRMAVDKKVVNGKIRLVLLDAIGSAYVTDSVDHQLLTETIQELTASS